MEAIVSHADADGIISASLLLKLKPKAYLTFSSHSFLHKTFCLLLDKGIKEVYILDISADRKNLTISSAFEKAYWIDHHFWENLDIPKNVQVFVEESESAAKVVSKILKIDSPLVEIANQIDTNNIKSEEAKFFRDLVSAIKWKYGKIQVLKFRQIAKLLAYHSIEELEKNVEYAKIIEEHLNWLNSLESEIYEKTRIFEIKNKKVAIFETTKSIPVYFIYEKLLKHEKAPFDIIAVIYRKINISKQALITKIELRTQTNQDVLKIAKNFNGGGHKVASGASINEYIPIESLVKKIEEII
ncbi:MAG: hypothetical protein ACP5H3_02275 [Candidatus Aenigmatarchaeota archaeon]|jgi:nanoRNase/pAp phosphatase (c-di-AMP/oligoRNAs hydrolase)